METHALVFTTPRDGVEKSILFSSSTLVLNVQRDCASPKIELTSIQFLFTPKKKSVFVCSRKCKMRMDENASQLHPQPFSHYARL